ncbi:MAG: PPOX class F420-dependent oxidoreductase [Proteobacteria bacterium]|nr:PPOX class F420-dependent oxidoreductase [Pseudomonadota bacterium]MCP4916171.1 PPOX class F420-dependent oxidoreductase [Pseudomonadota bacterium]
MPTITAEEYVSIETVRKNGTKAATPVWIAPLNGKAVFTTNGDSWKVKRIRNNPSVRLAPCDMKGENVGTYLCGTARILEGAAAGPINQAIKAKYSWKTWPFALIGLFQKVPRVGIEITLD